MESILSKIDLLIDNCTDSLINDIKKLVSIKSVQGEATDIAPFGVGPLAVLEEFKKMCQEAKLHFTDYITGTVSGGIDNAPIDVANLSIFFFI